MQKSRQSLKVANQNFQQEFGSFRHAAISTWPDLSKAPTILVQYLQNPSERCLKMADHFLSDLHGTRNFVLIFDGKKPTWEIFCDTFYPDNEERKRSQGLLFELFGEVVEYKSTKWKTITASTTEVELLAL